MNGNIANTGGTTRLIVFYGGGGTTAFNGIVTTGNDIRTVLLDGTTVNGGTSAVFADGLTEIRYGTLNLNNTTTPQQFNATLEFGDTTQASGNSTLNIASGATINLNTGITYVDDDNTANTANIDGGTLQITEAIAPSPSTTTPPLILSPNSFRATSPTTVATATSRSAAQTWKPGWHYPPLWQQHLRRGHRQRWHPSTRQRRRPRHGTR